MCIPRNWHPKGELLKRIKWRLSNTFRCLFLEESSTYQGSSSSNLSKLLVSISLFSSGMFGAFLSLMRFQSTPAKNGCTLISSTPLTPSLSSRYLASKLTNHKISLLASVIRRFSKSAAAGLKFASGGITSVLRQFRIFWQVIEGSSEKNGGYPTSISNRITPIDHQSTVSVYPCCVKTSGAI